MIKPSLLNEFLMQSLYNVKSPAPSHGQNLKDWITTAILGQGYSMDIRFMTQILCKTVGYGFQTEVINELEGDPTLAEAIFDICLANVERLALEVPGFNVRTKVSSSQILE